MMSESMSWRLSVVTEDFKSVGLSELLGFIAGVQRKISRILYVTL